MKILAAALLLAACAAAPPQPAPPSPLAGIPVRDIAADLAAPSGRSLLTALDVLPPSESLIRAVYPPTVCRSRTGVNPGIWLPRTSPRVGQEIVVLFVTRCGDLPPAPPADCWLIYSLRPLPRPIDWTPFGLPCWLLVQPDAALAVPTAPGGLVHRDGGLVWFRWTPLPSAAGTHLWMQLVVAAPGETPSGFLASHAVEIIVGFP